MVVKKATPASFGITLEAIDDAPCREKEGKKSYNVRVMIYVPGGGEKSSAEGRKEGT
jgi:hypothetical protein